MEIITPKNTLLMDNNSIEPPDVSLSGVHRIVQVGATKLTCCCEFLDWIVCGGFSGELFFIKSMHVDHVTLISNHIIRCVVPFDNLLLITTDGGELILFDGEKKKFCISTGSPVYDILPIDDTTIVTCERTGAIKEWKYIYNQIVFNRTLMLADGCIFSLAFINEEVIAVGAKGKKYVFEINKDRFFEKLIAPCNIFCITEGLDSEIYYGLSNGEVIREKKNDMKILHSHQDAVRDIVFSPQKQWMFSISKDNSVRAWHEGIPHILSMGKDYLYQIVVKRNYLFYVDGHGDLGRIDFEGDIDQAREIEINN